MAPSGDWLIDLTKPLNENTAIYREGAYADPEFAVRDWCEVGSMGFRVSSLEMGTQTGTHIDAPAHFLDGGATLDKLDLGCLIGPYFLVSAGDLADPSRRAHALEGHGPQGILFVAADASRVVLPERCVLDMIQLNCPVWAVACEVEIEGKPPLAFHRMLAEAGIYLIEDMDEAAARTVPRAGDLYALPLRLEGVSGSPCRVVVRARA